MSAGERKAFEAEATNFAESLKEIGRSGEKRLRLAARRAAAAALALGFYHAGNGEVVRGLRAKLGRQGGKKSVAGRKANWPWEPRANELAQALTNVDRSLSGGEIAAEIIRGWKAADVKCPSHRTLEGFVCQLRESGKLPQQSRSPRKRSRSLRKLGG